MTDETPSRFDRAFGRLRWVWQGIAGKPTTEDGAPFRFDARRVAAKIDECLAARGGEVSARTQAAELGETYLAWNERDRSEFLRLLATHYGIDRDRLRASASALASASEADVADAEAAVRRALIAPRVRLLTQFNVLPQGVKFLVDMRAEVQRSIKREPALAPLERDLKDLLASWFDVGFLELRRITWTSPAHLLEKLIAYEAVHAIGSWTDLKNRLDFDRRCYAFFHPRMPDEPIIFIEVALVQGLAGSIHALLDENAPAGDAARADTAIFYSISNAQKGLVGLDFGGFLIKRVVEQLSHDLPRLKTFATLSPIPGFRAWLEETMGAGRPVLTAAEAQTIAGAAGQSDGAAAFAALIADESWAEHPTQAEALRVPILRLGATYLTEAKSGGRARDRVANFHLSNGARVERVNWMANRSPENLKRAFGLMVNYGYDLGELESNHEGYRGEGRVAMSPAVKALLKGR